MDIDYYYFLLCTQKNISYSYLTDGYGLSISKLNTIIDFCQKQNYIKNDYENYPVITKNGIDYMNELSRNLKLRGCKKYIIPYNIYRSEKSENDIYIPENFI
ncbi:MAG: hypothetical protein N4A40_10615 [Tissierellales bacterium]|jgi:hypothetical protein|nr:hypothetical protein [Tissierellales bacterium]